jgi:sugar lactone lactonase YvrE
MTAPLRSARPLVVLAACLAGPAAAAAAPPSSYLVPGTKTFPEGVAVQPSAGRFFVGSLVDGSVFRGRLTGGAARPFLAPGAAGRTSVAGMKVDDAGRLIVAGASTGRVFVNDAASGRLLHVFSDGLASTKTFLNDLVPTPSGDVFVTDSTTPTLWRIPAAALAGPKRASLEPWLDLRGTPFRYVNGFNANGIVLTPDGQALLVVSTATGGLFRIGLSDKRVTRVPVRGSVAAGDGMLVSGRDLYVARNSAGVVVRVRMSPDFTSGRVVAVRHGPPFIFPTTLARAGNRLLVVNGQLDKLLAGGTPTLPFTISSVPIP